MKTQALAPNYSDAMTNDDSDIHLKNINNNVMVFILGW